MYLVMLFFPLLIVNDTVVFCYIVYIYHGHVVEQFCILNMFLPCSNKDIIIIYYYKVSILKSKR